MTAVTPAGSPDRKEPVARRISATNSLFMVFTFPSAAYFILAAKAALICGLARRAPSTVREPIVWSASSGVTSEIATIANGERRPTSSWSAGETPSVHDT